MIKYSICHYRDNTCFCERTSVSNQTSSDENWDTNKMQILLVATQDAM